jgi:predicted SAM-dependent methyltransferase
MGVNSAIKQVFSGLFGLKVSALPPYGDDVYYSCYPEDSLTKRAFYNFGAGIWRHKFWTNVDYASDYYNYDKSLIDIPWDITENKELPVASNSAELVYCSHTVEHLLNEHVAHMLREAYRILKPGGVIRITTPNAALFYWAYKRRDVYFNYHYGHEFPFGSGEHTYSVPRMSLWMVNEIATQLVQGVDGEARTGAKLLENCQEIDRIFNESQTMEAAFETICAMINFEHQRKVPGQHVNWWTNEKMSEAYRAAGFNHVIPNVVGGSVAPVMRDVALFDRVDPTFSIFVDAVK